MAKPLSPSQIANEEWMGRATSFTVSRFLGVGKFHTVPAATLDEARAIARGMADAITRAKPQPIIYGHTPEGRTAVYTGTY